MGNGRLTHIWEDKWLPTPTTYKVISPPRTFDDFPRVSALIDHETRRWKVELIRAVFLPFEADTILNMPLSYNLPEDKLIWTGNRRGDFTVKSAYYIACSLVEAEETGESSSGYPRTPPPPIWKKIWHLKIPSKIRIFSWRACMNGLPTGLNLSRRGVNISPMCPICDQERETTTHVLIQCEIAKQVWDRWQGRPMNMRGSQLLEITDAALKILKGANTIRWDFKEAVGVCLQSQNNEASRWEAPPSGMFKINVDGATSNDGRPSSVEVMIRDSKGNLVAALSKVL